MRNFILLYTPICGTATTNSGTFYGTAREVQAKIDALNDAEFQGSGGWWEIG